MGAFLYKHYTYMKIFIGKEENVQILYKIRTNIRELMNGILQEEYKSIIAC